MEVHIYRYPLMEESHNNIGDIHVRRLVLWFCMAFHSQMDEKTYVNSCPNQYLRYLESVDQRVWADYVGRAQFDHNVAMH